VAKEERAEEAAVFFDGSSKITSACVTPDKLILTREDGKRFVSKEDGRTGAGRKLARTAAETVTACLNCELPEVGELVDLFLEPRTITIRCTKGGGHLIETSS